MTKKRQSSLLLAICCILTVCITHADPLPGSGKNNWYRGNTHAHTSNSDGDVPPAEVARWYRDHSYQFLAITDHEYVTDTKPLQALLGADEKFLLIPGQEVSQMLVEDGYPDRRRPAHVNSIGTTELVMPMGRGPGSRGPGWERTTAPDGTDIRRTYARNIAAIRDAGGIAQIDHPNLLWSVKPADLDDVPDGTLLEIWNGQGHINNLGGDDGTGDARPSAEGFWDYLLSKGTIVWGVGSDDAHSFTEPGVNDPSGTAPGQAWIMVYAPALTLDAIKAALAAGAFYASTGVELEDIHTDAQGLTVTIKPPKLAQRFRTRFVGQGGQQLAEVAGLTASYRFTGSETYVRSVVTDSNGKQAWTQPVFRDDRRRASLEKQSRTR